MNIIPDKEKCIDVRCIVCEGKKVYAGKICFLCNGVGTYKWPDRCPGKCDECKFEPVDPVLLQTGDLIEVDCPDTGAHGKHGKVVEIHYNPCRGNYYECLLDGVQFGDSDGNAKIRGGRLILKKIGRAKTLFEF